MGETRCRARPGMSPSERARSRLLSSLESLGAHCLPTEQRKVAAVHQCSGCRDRAIDSLSQRRIFPLDGGDIARVLIEEDRSKLSSGHAFLLAIENPKKEDESSALPNGKPLASKRRSSFLAGQATMQALDAMQAGAEVAVEGNQERAATPTKSTNEPEPMTTRWIVEQNVPAIKRFDAHQHGRKAVEADRITDVETAWSRGDKNGGRRMLRPPQARRDPCRYIRCMRERPNPNGGPAPPSRFRLRMDWGAFGLEYYDNLQRKQDCGEETRLRTARDRAASVVWPRSENASHTLVTLILSLLIANGSPLVTICENTTKDRC